MVCALLLRTTDPWENCANEIEAETALTVPASATFSPLSQKGS